MNELKSLYVTAIGFLASLGINVLPSIAQAQGIVPASPTTDQSATFSKNKCSAIATVTSKPMPLPGQSHRSSQNFDLSSTPIGQVFKVETKKGVSFDIKLDKRRAIDPIITSGMKTGYYRRVSNSPLYPVYIADPRGAGRSDFAVKFCR